MPHAVNCRFLSSELKDLVADQAAILSLGAKQEAAKEVEPGLPSTSLLDFFYHKNFMHCI